ncbi:phospholipid scramblase 1 [Geranomyces variabilis]|nr:phospholipid scramblase 1 [Geranomyces variabilis]
MSQPHQYQDVALAPHGRKQEDIEREEADAFAEHVSNLIADAPELSRYLPVNGENLFTRLQDGVLLGAIINSVKANSVPLGKLNHNINPAHLATVATTGPAAEEKHSQEQTKAIFEATANLNICLAAAKHVAVVVNIGSDDFLRKKVDLVLGLLWQLIRAHLMSDINVPSHPELIPLLSPGESLKELIALSQEQLLVRWVNYHMVRAGSSKRITNFGQDIADCDAYVILLSQIRPWDKEIEVRDALLPGISSLAAPELRAACVLAAAERLNSRKFVRVANILAGHSRLNLLFVAGLFSRHIGIHLPSEDEAREMVKRAGKLEADCATYRARIVELEKTVSALAADNERQRADHEASLSAFDEKFQSESQAFQKSVDDLRAARDADGATFSDRVVAMEARFGALMDDRTKAVESQQRLNSFVYGKLCEVRDLIKKQNAESKRDIAQLEDDNATPINDEAPEEKIDAAVDEQLTGLSQDLKKYVAELLDENRSLNIRLRQHEQISHILGDKIKGYSEAQIKANPIKIKKGAAVK